MDFVAVVDQVIARLRQRGLLTYCTLQLQLQLDETHLEVLCGCPCLGAAAHRECSAA